MYPEANKMARELSHFIGGKSVSGRSGRFDDVFDPHTGAVQARVPLASEAAVEAAIADAAKAQPAWAALNPQRPARVLMKFLDLINHERELLAKRLSSEHGKTAPDAKGEFTDSAGTGPDSIRFYTKTKTVTSRWPSGVKNGAEFVIPTMA